LIHNLKKLETTFAILGHYIPIALASKCMRRFSPTSFSYRTLQFISMVENYAFSRHCQVGRQ